MKQLSPSRYSLTQLGNASGFGPHDTRKRRQTGASPEEGRQGSQGAGAPALRGEAEEMGPVQPGDERALEDHKAARQCLWGGPLRRGSQALCRCASGTTSDGGRELNQERF